MEIDSAVEDKKGIFKGCPKLICTFMGVKELRTLKNSTSYRELADPGKTPMDFERLLKDIYGQIELNRTERDPSEENWRADRQLRLSDKNESDEVLLERAIAILGERKILPEWANQVPVASGLVDSVVDKRAAVDLVRLEINHVDLVELKWKSDTPAFAAFEILLYGLAYLFCFAHKDTLGYASKKLMKVRTVSLRVLAPSEFYDGGNLAWLEQGLSTALRSLSAEVTGKKLSIDFGFMSFPRGFELPFGIGLEVNSMKTSAQTDDKVQAVVSAVSGRRAVW